jgi:dTDP-4-dehydrorhamnose reductase
VSLRDESAIEAIIAQLSPAAVINAAAYTRVDDAERERDDAFAINAVAPGVMARACASRTIRFIHFSTDYVFDGGGVLPYSVGAPTRPLNVYGESKRAGEVAVLEANPHAAVVRTAWVHSGAGVNFVGTATRLLTTGTSMKVVDDQIGTPTSARTLAEGAYRLLERRGVCGIQHLTDAGVASWFDVACTVLDEIRLFGRLTTAEVTPVESSAFPRPAARPKVSILDCHSTRQALDFVPAHWSHGVRDSVRGWLAFN